MKKTATFRIEMETIGKESVEIYKCKTVTEVKNSFKSLIHKLKTAEEKVSELEDRPVEITQNETQREKNESIEHSRAVGQYQRVLLKLTVIRTFRSF